MNAKNKSKTFYYIIPQYLLFRYVFLGSGKNDN